MHERTICNCGEIIQQCRCPVQPGDKVLETIEPRSCERCQQLPVKQGSGFAS